MKQSAVLMTEGPIARQMIRFAGPVFLGNLFQQLYNMVDSLIVGNFAGDEALAAVSSSGNLIFLFVGFIFGLFAGAGVIIARYYGAGDEEEVKKSIHTTLGLSLICGIAITIFGIFFSPLILRVMGTPKLVFPNSVIYFRVYFMGGIAVCLFNASSGIFQAVGDSSHPLYYLIIASVINVVLDLIAVGYLNQGVLGAALATIISQCIAAGLSLWKLSHTKEAYRIDFKLIKIDTRLAREILKVGVPSGVQNSVIGLANTVVQSNINSFGELAVAGCGTYSKIEGFVFLPITSFSIAITTFVSQNVGAGNKERVKKGSLFGVLSAMGLAEAIGIIIFIFMPIFLSFFSPNPEVISIGTTQARTESLFYFLLAGSHAMAGVLRGKGKAIVPMIVMLAVWCVLRVIYITVAVSLYPVIWVIFIAYPLTWSISSVIFGIYLRRSR